MILVFFIEYCSGVDRFSLSKYSDIIDFKILNRREKKYSAYISISNIWQPNKTKQT